MSSTDIARAVVASIQDALRRHDADRLVGLFEPSGVLAGTAAYNRGGDAIRDYLTHVVAQDGVIVWELPELDVWLERADLLGFSGEGTVLLEGDETTREPIRLSIVAERRGEEWTVVHFHGSVPEQA